MKKPDPWPVTWPRPPPRGPPRKPGGMPSGPPKRRKKRSIGEPGWNGESSLLLLLALSSLPAFSAMLTFTEITDGFTRSTMSAKPIGFSTLRTSLRSEEHTSELQSRQYLVCRLLLEKK